MATVKSIIIASFVQVLFFPQDTTCANESNIQTDKETDKTMTVGEIADFPKKR